MMEKWCPLCGHSLSDSKSIFIDEESNSIILDGKAIKAQRRIRQVVGLLIEKSPRIVSRGFMMDSLYGLETEEEEPAEKIIDVFIAHARKAIKGSDYEIDTIWGKGWLFRRKVLHEDEHQDQRKAG